MYRTVVELVTYCYIINYVCQPMCLQYQCITMYTYRLQILNNNKKNMLIIFRAVLKYYINMW